MLSVSGIVFIAEQPEIKQAKNGAYFNIQGVAKDPYKEGRKWYRVAVYVPADHVATATDVLAAGKTIQIRIGELDGTKNEKGFIFCQTKTNWEWIEPLTVSQSK